MLKKSVIFEFFDKTHKSCDMRFFVPKIRRISEGEAGFCGESGIMVVKVDFRGVVWVKAGLCEYRLL